MQRPYCQVLAAGQHDIVNIGELFIALLQSLAEQIYHKVSGRLETAKVECRLNIDKFTLYFKSKKKCFRSIKKSYI